jgi:acyl carrier protein
MTPDAKTLILECLAHAESPVRLEAADVPDSFDLRAEGVIDSLGFLRLLTELEARLGFEIDLADLDPADLTTIGPLAAHIAAAREQRS